MKKFFCFLGIGLLVLIVMITVVAGLYVGPIVKIGMETVGPKIVQVPITVDAVNVSVLTGSFEVKGLIVGNPKGYKLPDAIKVGTIAVNVDPFSFSSNKIIVHSVKVESPEITFEGGLKANNLSKIMENINAQVPKGAGGPSAKIEVDDFLITGARVHVSLTGFFSKQMTLPLPTIHLTDLGKNSGGLTPLELTRAVLNAIISGIVKALTGAVTAIGHGVENLGKGAGNSVGQGVSKLTNSIGGLFGK